MILDDKRLHFNYDADKYIHRRYLGFTTAIGTAILGATAGTAAATAVGIGVTGLAAYGAYKGFSALTAKPKEVATADLPGAAALKEAEPSYNRAEELAKKQTDAKRRGIARNKPQYTSPLGLTPLDQSNLNLKTLTGA